MQILVVKKAGEANKVKGDLLENLANHLLIAQDFEISSRNMRRTGVELDLVCKHRTIKKHEIYVECKAYEKEKIQSQTVTSLMGIRDLHEYEQAWLISTSPIGNEAKGIIDKLEKGANANKYAFYTPERLIQALTSSNVIIQEDACRQAVINVVQSPKKLGDAYFLITKYGYFWAFEYLKGGEPDGIIFVDSKDGEPVADEDLLKNLVKLECDLNALNYMALLDILSLTNDEAVIDDVKSLKLEAARTSTK